MVRIIGILCGSAIAIAFLIIALGIPEVLPARQATAEVITEPEPVAEVTAVIDSPATTEIPSNIEPDIELADEALEETAVEPQVMPVPDIESWYAFWSPFRSELAANGFITQLQRITGLDYRVVRLQPGVYEVAFLHDGDSDIQDKLAEISAATGLEMPDG